MSNDYIYFRLWPGFKISSGFPFDQFNSLPDNQILGDLDKSAHEWEDTNKVLITEVKNRKIAKDKHREQSLQPRRLPSIDVNDEALFERFLEIIPVDELKDHARLLGVQTNKKSESELVESIFRAGKEAVKRGDFEYKRSTIGPIPHAEIKPTLQKRYRDSLESLDYRTLKIQAKKLGISTGGNKKELLKLVYQTGVDGINEGRLSYCTNDGLILIEKSSIPYFLQIARNAGWANRSKFEFNNSPASQRYYVSYPDSNDKTRHIIKVLKLQFSDDDLCPVFGVVSSNELSCEERIIIERTIDDLLKKNVDDLVKFNEDDKFQVVAQKIVREAVKIADKYDDIQKREYSTDSSKIKHLNVDTIEIGHQSPGVTSDTSQNDTTANKAVIQTPVSSVKDKSSKLKPYQRKAFQQYMRAYGEMDVQPINEKEAYDWLESDQGTAKDELPFYDTWSKYLREVKSIIADDIFSNLLKSTREKSARSSISAEEHYYDLRLSEQASD